MSTYDSPFLEEIASDLFSLNGDSIKSKNHCDGTNAMDKTIRTLAELQAYTRIFNSQFFKMQVPNFAVMLSDDKPQFGYMASGVFFEDDGSAVSIIFFNHLLLQKKPPRDVFAQISMFMANLWTTNIGGTNLDGTTESNDQLVFTLGSIFEFMGIETFDLEAGSNGDTSASYQIVSGGKFDRLTNLLIQKEMTIDWPERAYRSDLGLICRFGDSADNSKTSTTKNSALR